MEFINKPTLEILSSPHLQLPIHFLQPMLDGQLKGDIINCAIENGTAIGYCMLVKHVNGNYLNVFVNSQYQKKGVGYSLSKDTIRLAFLDPTVESINISIAIKGPSHALAKKLCFVETFRDENEIYFELLRSTES